MMLLAQKASFCSLRFGEEVLLRLCNSVRVKVSNTVLMLILTTTYSFADHKQYPVQGNVGVLLNFSSGLCESQS